MTSKNTKLHDVLISELSTPYQRWTPRRITAFVIEVIFVLLLWSVIIAKIYYDDASEVFRFLTNWTWMLNCVFWTLDLAFGYAFPSTFFTYFSALFVWFVNGVNWVVFWLVFALLYNNPQMIQDAIEEIHVTLGVVLIGERAFHVLLTIWTTVWLQLRSYEIRIAFADIYFNGVVAKKQRHFEYRYLVWLLNGILAPMLFFGFWRAFNDPEQVYGIAFQDLAVCLALIAIVAGVNAAAMLMTTQPQSAQANLVFRILFFVTWSMTLFIVAVMWLAKIGVVSYIEHFELWLLTFSLVYFAIAFVSTVNRLYGVMIWTLFWTLNTLTWLVFWFAFVAYTNEASRILDVCEDGIVDGTDFIVDRILRVLPVIALLLFIAVIGNERLAWRRHFASLREAISYGFAGSVLVPLLIVAAYRGMFDPCLVYGNTTYDWTWVVAFIVITLFFGVGTQLLILWVVRKQPHTKITFRLNK